MEDRSVQKLAIDSRPSRRLDVASEPRSPEHPSVFGPEISGRVPPDVPGPRDAAAELDLMRGVKAGDRKSFEMLIARYWHPLIRYANGIVRARDDSEDVVQEAFVRVWQCRLDWTPVGTVASYLYRITRNLALNSLRDREALRRRLGRNVEDEIRARSESGLRHSQYESLRAEVEAEVAKLSAKRREVFLLARFYGLSHREIAETMEISVSTVANHMTSALSQLRRALSHHRVE